MVKLTDLNILLISPCACLEPHGADLFSLVIEFLKVSQKTKMGWTTLLTSPKKSVGPRGKTAAHMLQGRYFSGDRFHDLRWDFVLDESG